MPSITTWFHLEPSPRDDDLSESLAARIRDPLWFLNRQWVMGEFDGDDAGSPAYVRMTADLAPFVGWMPGEVSAPLDRGQPMERVLTEEPRSPDDLTVAAELGLVFERALTAGGVAELIPEYRNLYSLFGPNVDDDPDAALLRSAWRGRVVDGAGLLTAARAARPALPPPVVPAEQADIVRTALNELDQWAREVHEPVGTADPAAWHADQLDYQGHVSTGGGELSALFRVVPGARGEVDWYSFDHVAGAVPAVAGAAIETRSRTLLPTGVEFRGMPKPRFWDFEDGRVDFARMTPDRHDLPRLLFMDFFLVHGNDWYVIPFEQPLGTVCRIRELVAVDVFGEAHPVARVDQRSGRNDRWAMFATESERNALADWLVVPPSGGPAVQRGLTLEDVRFLRDETANLVWAVERTLESGAGVGKETVLEIAAAPVAVETDATLRYLLQHPTPRHWLPFLPVRVSELGDSTVLELGSLLAADAAPGDPPRIANAAAKILRPPSDHLYRIREEEIPREGARVMRVVHRCRWTDGSTHTWIARIRSIGRGEGDAGLRFDDALGNQRQR